MKPKMRNRFVFVATLSAVVSTAAFAQSPHVAVDGVGVTVSDMERAVAFYSALTFQKVSDTEVLGEEYEHLEGVFGARMRIVRMQLGDEHIDLIEYLAPRGRPIPVDSRSNDLWFQHIAIVVRDMDQAFAKLRELKVRFVSTAPQTLPASIPAAAGIKAFYFRDPDQHNLEIIYFPLGRSEEHTSELQSQSNLVCRLLLEKKKLAEAPQAVRHLPELRASVRRFGAALSFLLGIEFGALMIPSLTYLMENTPDHVRGRVFALLFMVINGVSALPVLVAAALADTLGIDRVIGLLGVLLVLTGISVAGLARRVFGGPALAAHKLAD